MSLKAFARASLVVWSIVSTIAPALAFERPCIEALRRLTSPRRDSTAELEIPLTRDVLRMLTTEDGTVGPVLNGKASPRWLKAKLPFHMPWDAPDPRNISWRELTMAEQIRLIAYANHDAKFWRSRRIPGLKVRDTVLFESDKPFNFRGQDYEAGTHEIPMEETMGVVEFSSEHDITKLRMIHRREIPPDDRGVPIGVELHFRDHKSAGTVANDAWTLAKFGFRAQEPHLHVHYLRDFVKVLPKGSSALRIAKVADFNRRGETFANMHSILNRGLLGTSVDKGNPNVILFGTLGTDDFRELVEVYEEVAKGNHKALGSKRFKMGGQGVRGPDTYESEELLVGNEFRSITKPDNIEAENRELYKTNVSSVLDGMQATFEDRNFGLEQNRIKNWLASGPQDLSLAERIATVHYNERDLAKLIARAPEEIKKRMKEPGAVDRFAELIQFNEGFNMLLHDWSKDPLFFDRPDLIARIQRVQLAEWEWVTKRLDGGGAPLRTEQMHVANSRLCRFLLDSGLFEAYGASVGVRVKIPAH